MPSLSSLSPYAAPPPQAPRRTAHTKKSKKQRKSRTSTKHTEEKNEVKIVTADAAAEAASTASYRSNSLSCAAKGSFQSSLNSSFDSSVSKKFYRLKAAAAVDAATCTEGNNNITIRKAPGVDVSTATENKSNTNKNNNSTLNQKEGRTQPAPLNTLAGSGLLPNIDGSPTSQPLRHNSGSSKGAAAITESSSRSAMHSGSSDSEDRQRRKSRPFARYRAQPVDWSMPSPRRTAAEPAQTERMDWLLPAPGPSRFGRHKVVPRCERKRRVIKRGDGTSFSIMSFSREQ